MRQQLILLSTLVCIFLSCKNKKEDIVGILGQEYFPLNPGKEYIYQVDSIIFDDFNQSVDTFTSRLRIRYVSQFFDSSNTPAIRVEYDNPDKGFNEPNNRWASVIKFSENAIINYSDTFRTIKMVFPVKEGKSWNTNLYNNQNPKFYKFKNVDKPLDLNNFKFSQTVMVQQNELKTLLTEISAFEIYAKNIGMIYSENVFIQRFDGKVSGKKIITSIKEFN
ncbi:MAG: hypothetical protein J5I91_09725 [Bacteroidetes bacterium]|nr:hypothetical protein [Bacteroidota bacterium]